MSVCWCFTSWQHRRSYQEVHWLALVHTHCNFIVLPHQEIRPPAQHMTRYLTQFHYPDPVPTSPCPSLVMANARLGNDKYKFDKSLVWLGWVSKSQSLCSTDFATAPVRKSVSKHNFCNMPMAKDLEEFYTMINHYKLIGEHSAIIIVTIFYYF